MKRLSILTLLIAALSLTPSLSAPVWAQNTALNRTTAVLLTNKSGGAVSYGDVVILDNTNANGFTTTTTGALSTRGLGVVLEPSGIANNASGMVALGGWVPKVNLNTAAAVGQFLKTHTVAGQATPHASPQVEGDFGIALSASATPPAILFSSPNGPQAAGSGTVTNTGTLTSGKLLQGNGGVDVTVNATTATVTKLTSGTPSAATSGTDYVAPIGINSVVRGRLTTETGVAVSISDQTAKSTIYFTPYQGNQIALYTGSAWVVSTFSELSLALSGLTSGKNYDVFVDYNSGTPQLVLSAAWASDTARTDSIALQDGVYVKSGTTTYRLVGTIRTTATTTTEDSAANRFVWNVYNRATRAMRNATETTDNWSYSSTTWREARGSTTNQLNFVMGLAEDSISATVATFTVGGSGYISSIGIGCNSTTVPTPPMQGSATPSVSPVTTSTACSPVLGYSFVAWLEANGGATSYYGDNAITYFQAGITGTIRN